MAGFVILDSQRVTIHTGCPREHKGLIYYTDKTVYHDGHVKACTPLAESVRCSMVLYENPLNLELRFLNRLKCPNDRFYRHGCPVSDELEPAACGLGRKTRHNLGRLFRLIGTITVSGRLLRLLLGTADPPSIRGAPHHGSEISWLMGLATMQTGLEAGGSKGCEVFRYNRKRLAFKVRGQQNTRLLSYPAQARGRTGVQA